MARFQEIYSGIDNYYLKTSWTKFASIFDASTHITALKFQTDSSIPFYLSYRTYNKGKGWLPYVSSKDSGEYAGFGTADTRYVQAVGIKVLDSATGVSLDKNYIVMYRVFTNDKWLPWVSNATPELMYAVFNEFNLGGSLDTSSGNAGLAGTDHVLTRFQIRIFKDNNLSEDTDSFTGGEINTGMSYLVDSEWKSFTDRVTASHIDGLKIQTSTNRDYYLLYKTWNEGKTGYYPAVKSTEDDYAGSPGKPIQKVNIQVCKNDGTKLGSGVIVMYRACVEGEWLPWVSNAEPEWMRSVQTKYGLGGTLDTELTYAGSDGKNIEGIEIRIFEDDSTDAGAGSFIGGETAISMRYMADSSSNWKSFNGKVLASPIDGLEIRTSATDYYLLYKTWNEGKTGYYPAVKSTDDDYAGTPGKPIQRLNIKVYKNDGTQLTSGVVVMYRAYVDGKWLPWVSNADPEWMTSVKSQYNLDGTLDVESGYAGISGKNIAGIEIRVFEGSTVALPEEELQGTEAQATLSYLKDGSWKTFSKKVQASGIDGIKIQTSASKSYYLSYKTQNSGQTGFYPAVKSTEDDYAGYTGKAIQKLSIQVYKNDGTKLASGVVVMYRAYVDGAWLPWVSNADPEWMQSVQVKYALGGRLDTSSYYAGIGGKDIEGIEIRIFEENSTTVTPTGDYKIINVPFITQNGSYPTGCESVTTVMALKYAGCNITVDGFIDNYLDKQSYPFDPSVTFGGSPYSTSGFGCYAPVIKKALDKFLSDSEYFAKVMYQISLEELCAEYIDNDIPVILWATMGMKTPYVSRTWNYNGKTINWIAPEHCLLLVGYDDNHYIFNDPLKYTAFTYYSKEAVETAYRGLYSQAIVLVEDIPATEVLINHSSVELIEGEMMELVATVLPDNAVYDSITWTSSDSSVATVNMMGMVTAKNIGTANIMATIGDKSDTCRVTVVGTKQFGELGAKGYIKDDDVEKTSDNFFITQKSLANILSTAGINELEAGSAVQSYYDDWYLFSVQQSTEVSYGLCKMREQEFDGGDGDAQGITISFVGFDMEKLMNCINNPTTSTKQILSNHIADVVENYTINDERIRYDERLSNYFKDAKSKAPYLIADMYIRFLASTAVNGVLEAPVSCKSLLQHYSELNEEVNSPEFSLATQEYQAMVLKELNDIKRVPLALKNNNEQAGKQIYLDDKIYIANSSNLTIYEKYAILMSHTGNVNFNSFAAEVVFHAEALEDFWANFNRYYNSALRADMALGEEYESGFFDQYYDLEGELVQDQIRYHGEL